MWSPKCRHDSKGAKTNWFNKQKSADVAANTLLTKTGLGTGKSEELPKTQ